MRVELLLASLALAGCSKESVVEVTLDSAQPVKAVASLRVTVSNAGQTSGPSTLSAGATPVDIPPSTAFSLRFPSDRAGEIDVMVDAVDAASKVLASGSGMGTIDPGALSQMKVTLGGMIAMGDMGVVDGAPPTDAELADFAAVDSAVADSAPPDITLDLAKPPRMIFLLTAHTPDLSNIQGGLDNACQTEAKNAQLPIQGTMKAVIGYPNQPDPVSTIVLKDHTRPIVLPSGKQVATDDTFFTANHTAAISEIANGTTDQYMCAFTNFTAQGALKGFSADDACAGWTSASNTVHGNLGQANAFDSTWAFGENINCTFTCHVYCIEQ